jgi:glycosyltransferase involved in cell wall biosynthesis
MTELDVILVGPYPPPRGGVSAHIARLAHGLGDRGLTIGVVNHFHTSARDPLVIANLRRNPWRYWRVLRTARAQVVHYHHSRWYTLLVTAFALRRSPAATVATIHGRGLEPLLSSRAPGVAPLTRWALRSFDVLIAVSVEVEASLASVAERPVALIPAYLPVAGDPAALSRRAEEFLTGTSTLLMSAYRLTVDKRGRTIYGLETAIAGFAQLAGDHPHLCLAIFLASAPRSRRDARLLENLLAGAGGEDVRQRIGIFYGEPLAPALRLAGVYLRPTLTDGDAVSVREALAAGVPVLASDVVGRPPGVTTVGLDASAWAREIERALSRGPRVPSCPQATDPLEQVIDIYDRLRPSTPARPAAQAA